MLYVFTGDGKGKTTAALGLIMRAYGAGRSCAIIFFDKNPEYCNELTTLKELGIHSYIFGINRMEESGFRFENKEEDFREAKKALDAAYEIQKDGNIDILILDEILNVVKAGLIPLKEASDFIDLWPVDKYLVLTGRGLPDEIREKAQLISEIMPVRHPLSAGLTAEKGIDY